MKIVAEIIDAKNKALYQAWIRYWAYFSNQTSDEFKNALEILLGEKAFCIVYDSGLPFCPHGGDKTGRVRFEADDDLIMLLKIVSCRVYKDTNNNPLKEI